MYEKFSEITLIMRDDFCWIQYNEKTLKTLKWLMNTGDFRVISEHFLSLASIRYLGGNHNHAGLWIFYANLKNLEIPPSIIFVIWSCTKLAIPEKKHDNDI